VIVIEGAERFGLAQIHQLRGRVGRGKHQSFCFLVPSSSGTPTNRLRALETLNDGFKLAEKDLQLRGPGAIYGVHQHGQLDLKYSNLSDVLEIARAKKYVAEFMQSGQDLLNYPRLNSLVMKFKSITHLN